MAGTGSHEPLREVKHVHKKEGIVIGSDCSGVKNVGPRVQVGIDSTVFPENQYSPNVSFDCAAVQ